MPLQAAIRRMTVGRAVKLLSKVAAAVFFLTVILTLNMSSRIRRVLMTSANCGCSCTNGSDNNNKDRTATNRLLREHLPENIRLPSVCVNESCRSDYVRLLQRDGAHPIPKIRHILWRNETVSEYFAEQLRTWHRIHPNWRYVLWRDADMDPFVASFFPGLLAKFRSLPDNIMRVDMIRYMLMYKYGGTYADLDYRLVASLDGYRRYHSVLTQEPEAHSLHFLGLNWPIRPLANSAFVMSAPGHTFYQFVLQRLHSTDVAPKGTFFFAGPHGLSVILERYRQLFPVVHHAMAAVYVPPSFSFHPYERNRLNTSRSNYVGDRRYHITERCKTLMLSKETAHKQLRQHRELVQYCTDINNMDPITDKSQPVIAVHDLKKSASIYDESGVGYKFYEDKPTDMRKVVRGLMFGQDFMAGQVAV